MIMMSNIVRIESNFNVVFFCLPFEFSADLEFSILQRSAAAG